MTARFLKLVVAMAAAWAFAGVARAQQADNPVYFQLNIEVWYLVGQDPGDEDGDFSFWMTDEEGNDVEATWGIPTPVPWGSTIKYSGVLTAKLYPNKKYTANVNYYSVEDGTVIRFQPVTTSGARLLIDDAPIYDLEYEATFGGSDTIDIFIDMPLERNTGQLRAGESTAINTEKPIWYLDLGNTRYGDSAGYIGFRQPNFDASDFFTPDILYYENPDDSEIDVVTSSGTLRQVYSREVLVDIETATSTSYTLEVFARSAVTGYSGGLYTTGSNAPFATYTLSKITGTNMVGIKIAREEDAEDWETSLEYNSSTEIWTHRDWRRDTAHADTRLETDVSGSPATVEQYGFDGAAQNASLGQEWTKTYSSYSWDTELVAQELGADETVPLLTDWEYYTSTSTQNDELKGRLESILRPDGSWVRYTYYTTGGSSSPPAGMIKRTYHSWLSDESNPANASTTNSAYEDWTYAEGPAGSYTVPASRIRYAPGGDVISKTEWSYDHDWTTKNSYDLAKETRKDFWDTGSSDYLTTVTTYHSQVESDLYFRGRPVSVSRPNGSKDAYVYFRDGTWTKSGYDFDASTSGDAQMILVLHGQSTAGSSPWAGNSTTSWSRDGETWSTDTVYMVPNRSTITETIIDIHGRVVLRAENIYISANSMERISGTFYDYDENGRLIAEVDIMRSTGTDPEEIVAVTRTYLGPLLETETSLDGVVTKYEYDDLLRQTKKTTGFGGSSPYPAKVQTFAYDDAGRLKESSECDCSSDPTIFEYDDAGRIEFRKDPPPVGEEEEDPDPLVTMFVYQTKQKTKTSFPNGADRIVENHIDGRPKSVTGDAQPAEDWDYEVDSDPLKMKHTTGTSPDTAVVEETRDLLGRVTVRSTDTWDWGSSSSKEIEVSFDYNDTTGLLWRQQTQNSGSDLIPDTIYEYNPAGQRIREGMDLNNDAASDGEELDNSDRVTEYDGYLVNGAWGWYRVDTVSVAEDTSGSPYTQVAKTQTRLTGFNNGSQPGTGQFVVGDVVSFDADGRYTVQWDYLEPDAKKSWSTVDPQGQDLVTARTTINGYLSEETTLAGVKSRYEYDAKGRLQYEKTRHNGTSYEVVSETKYYDGTSVVKSVTQNNGKVEYAYEWDDSTNSRTVIATTKKDTTEVSTVYTQYDAMDLPQYVWGDGATPTEYTYDDLGRRTEMKTWRSGAYTSGTWPNGLSDLATTKWEYQNPGGLLARKLYDGDTTGNPGIEYEYDLLGRVTKRTWDRGAYTEYEYNGNGELWKVDDSTTGADPDVTFTYTHLGQVATVAESIDGTTVTRTFAYDSSNPLRVDYEALGGFYGSNRRITYQYQSSGAPGRLYGFQLGTSSNPDADLDQTVSFTSKGLINQLTTKRNNGGSSRTFTYGYNSTTVSGLVETLSTGSFTLERDYESDRNAVMEVKATWNSSIITEFDYEYNEIGQRIWVKQSGTAFNDYNSAITRKFTYAATGELTDAIDYLGDDTSSLEVPGRSFRYAYDNLGNRTSVNHSTSNDANIRNDYTFGSVGSLNQYADRENNTLPVSGTADSDHVLAVLAGGSGGTAERQGNTWHYDLAVDNASGPWEGNVDVYIANAAGTQYDEVQIQDAALPERDQDFTYDEDGNLTNDGIWAYTWDADNRLATMDRTTAAVSAGYPDQTIEFDYDYLGRRVFKKVTEGASVIETRYLYEGWNLIAEFDYDNSTLTLTRTYTWGLDIASGSSTGGVGALVQLTDHGSGTDYLPTYDGNGNLTALVDASNGDIDAAYEYTPYGELLRAEGSYADDNPFRFSTKYTDTESGMVYFGYRHYDPANGRFLNRDPIEEEGGINLYAFAGNDPVNNIDVQGLTCWGYNDTECYEEELEGVNPAFAEMMVRIFKAMAAEATHYAGIEAFQQSLDNYESASFYLDRARRVRDMDAAAFWLGELRAQGKLDDYIEERAMVTIGPMMDASKPLDKSGTPDATDGKRYGWPEGTPMDFATLGELEFLGWGDYNGSLTEADRLKSRRLPRIFVPERTPTYTWTPLPSLAKTDRALNQRWERMHPETPKGRGWNSINDIPTINPTADRVLVGIAVSPLLVAGGVIAAPYVTTGAVSAGGWGWSTGRTIATNTYRWAQLNPGKVVFAGDFISGFLPGEPPRTPGAALGAGIKKTWDWQVNGEP